MEQFGSKDPGQLSDIENSSLGRSDLASQMNFISQINNNPYVQYTTTDGKLSKENSKIGLLQHLLYQEDPKYYPVSCRNRNLFAFLQDKQQFYNLKKRKEPEMTIQTNTFSEVENLQNASKKRKQAPKIVKVTAEKMGLKKLPNLIPDRTLYKTFKEQIISEGIIQYRTYSEDITTIIMNSYSIETGFIQPTKFEHITLRILFGKTYLKCSCPIYIYLTDLMGEDQETILDNDEMTCMHCRFVDENVVKKNLNQNTTLLSQKLKITPDTNKAIVILNRDKKSIKFSVVDEENYTCSFVNLSPDGEYIACQSGACRARMTNKKKIINLTAMSETTKICYHLSLMHQNQQDWTMCLPVSVNAEPENINDAPIQEETSQSHFNPVTCQWNFGGLSTHCPQDQRDIYLSRKTVDRAKYMDMYAKRDNNHYLIGPDLVPNLPETCNCSAGFEAKNEPVLDYTTNLYTRYSVLKARVFKHICKAGTCTITYNGEQDCLHQWSKEICAGDEIGWDFVSRVLNSHMSFTGFVNDMTRIYQSYLLISPPFMSPTTFIRWIFSWMAAMKIDFRQEVDPWCKHSPKMLACDGTHVGVTLRQLKMKKKVEDADINAINTPLHKRYDRVLLPYIAGQETEIRQARQHLREICQTILKPNEEQQLVDLLEKNEALLNVVNDERLEAVILILINKTCSQSLHNQLAYILNALAKDAPLISFLPWRYLDSILNKLREILYRINVDNNLAYLQDIIPEFALLLKRSLDEHLEAVITDFIAYLCESIKETHKDDSATNPVVIPDTYNPESGISYYFTDHGCQLRKTPIYNVSRSAAGMFDDAPIDACQKKYPLVSKGGYSYMFLWFCPMHGHCYGYHLIPGAEGRKDPFHSLYKYCPTPPEEIFYDFACSLEEYALNREPHYFRQSRMWHDIFHSYGHKCPYAYKSSRLPKLSLANTEICEQFNSFIQCIKYTGSHLSQSHFTFFMQFFISIWNKKKTQSYEKRIEIVYAGSL